MVMDGGKSGDNGCNSGGSLGRKVTLVVVVNGGVNFGLELKFMNKNNRLQRQQH